MTIQPLLKINNQAVISTYALRVCRFGLICLRKEVRLSCFTVKGRVWAGNRPFASLLLPDRHPLLATGFSPKK
jgi:hypothetical protein